MSFNATDIDAALKSVSVTEASDTIKSECSEVVESAGDQSADVEAETSSKKAAEDEHKDPSAALEKLVDDDKVKCFKYLGFNPSSRTDNVS